MRFSQRRATLRSRRGSPATFRDGALSGIALDVSRLRRSPSRGLLPRRMPSLFLDPPLVASFHVAGGHASSSIPWSAPSSAAKSLAREVDPLLAASIHVAGSRAPSSIPLSMPSSTSQGAAPPHRSPSRCPPLPHQGTAFFVDAPDGRHLHSDTEHCAARRRREFTPAAGERSVRQAEGPSLFLFASRVHLTDPALLPE
jgi:hypothetical protein